MTTDLEALRDLIAEQVEPRRCTDPAYGHPGYAHCMDCCNGTGWDVTSLEELDMVEMLDAAVRMIDKYLEADAERRVQRGEATV